MSQRYAPYQQRFLSPSPKCLCVMINSANANTSATQTLAGAPYNVGIVNVVTTTTNGEYKISLGMSATSRDSYRNLAGVDFVSDQADTDIDELTNVQCNHATDPNVTFQLTNVSEGTNTELADEAQAWIRLYFADSGDDV